MTSGVTQCHPAVAVSASVLGKPREGALRGPVPPHARDGVLPSALHLVQGGSMRLVPGRDGLLQVLVLRLDHFVSGVPVQREIAWSAQLLTGHRLHETNLGAMSRRLLIRSCSCCLTGAR